MIVLVLEKSQGTNMLPQGDMHIDVVYRAGQEETFFYNMVIWIPIGSCIFRGQCKLPTD